MGVVFRFLYLLLFAITINLQSCVKIPITNIPFIILTDVPPTVTFPVTYYLGDGFSIDEAKQIEDSFNDWNISTNGFVKAELVTSWKAPMPFNPDFYYSYKKRTIWKVYEDDYWVQVMFARYQMRFGGFSSGNFYIIVDRKENPIPLNIIYAISLHEFGHQIGLEHISRKYPAIMNPGCDAGIITHWDVVQFCQKYQAYQGNNCGDGIDK